MPPAAKRSAGRPKIPLTREDIVAIAIGAFADHGYAGASMRIIAERVGIRKSSLFHHFVSKDALYDAVFANLLEELSGLLEGLGGDWLTQLDTLGDRLTGWLGAHPHASRLLMREIVSSGPVLDGTTSQAIHGTMAATAAFLQEGMRQGAIIDSHPGHLAVSIVGLHLTWFAAAPVSTGVAGCDVLTATAIQQRKDEVRSQVRRLCGAVQPPHY